jgi:hypothetical protein
MNAVRLAAAHRDRQAGEMVLQDVIGSPLSHQFARRLVPECARDDDDGDVRTALACDPDRRQPIELRHPVIRQDEVRHERLQRPLERAFRRRPPGGKREAGAAQCALDQFRVGRHILEDQYPELCVAAAAHRRLLDGGVGHEN